MELLGRTVCILWSKPEKKEAVRHVVSFETYYIRVAHVTVLFLQQQQYPHAKYYVV